ncbi:MAG: single-stranded-DNA-specific exonuclease RecJ [Bacillus sp. (in: firmicutes)]
MLQSKTRWNVKKADQHAINVLTAQLNITPLVAQLLVNRGLDTVESARSFLFMENMEFHDPFLLQDMEKAVQRIRDAINKEEKILIFGDYDADGVTSTTVLLETLLSLGAQADFYIPNRFTEGYGPNEAAFRSAKDNGIDLIITVDTGISAIHEAEVARELGMDYIITDHHEPGPVLPEALAIIHPKIPGSLYPCKDLAGVGVAFKLAHALLGEVPEHLLEIAVIGTIADLVPLSDENRLIALKGIDRLRNTSRPGLLALFRKAGIEKDSLNEESIGFGIGPRINAVGRLGDADPAVDLLLTRDEDFAESLAEEIDLLNKERQAIVAEITKEAIRQVEEKQVAEDRQVLVVGAEGWNAGVIGIVASKLVEKYYRPVIVLSYDLEKGLAKGSARSITGFDLYGNLSKCRDILPHFGGHPMAAGMTLHIKDVDELRDRLNEQAQEVMTEEDFTPITNIDAIIQLEDISIQSIEDMGQLAPFGMANPKPKVMLSDVGVSTMKRIGADGSHLKAVLKVGEKSLDGVGFGMGDYCDEIARNASLSVIGELSVNEWNNIRKPQIFLQDLSVNHWQLFDMRGNKKWQHLFAAIPDERTKVVFFSRELAGKVHSLEGKEAVLVENAEQALQIDLDDCNVVLIDLPGNEEVLQTLLRGQRPRRLYAHFHQDQQHYFSTIPTREHFKWLYGLLLKKGPLDLNRYSDEIAKHKGWSQDTVEFMCKVFFELEFVTIENGIISVKQNAPKRDMSESPSYAGKQQQIKMENELLYSSYQQLYRKIETYLTVDEAELKEEIESWI